MSECGIKGQISFGVEMNFTPDFIQIPRQVFFSKNLTEKDKFVYGIIYWYTHLKGERCFASNLAISEIAQVTPRKISEAVSRLQKEGFVDCIYKDEEKRNRLEIVPLIVYGKRVTKTIDQTDYRIDQMDNRDTPNGLSIDRPNGLHIKNINTLISINTYDFEFPGFYNKYPLKVAKAKAYASWLKMSADERKRAWEAISAQIEAKHFRGQDGKDYIPHPATWLNQKRWEDEVKIKKDNNYAKI